MISIARDAARDACAASKRAEGAREDVWERARGGFDCQRGVVCGVAINRRFAPTEIRAVEPRFLREMAVFL